MLPRARYANPELEEQNYAMSSSSSSQPNAAYIEDSSVRSLFDQGAGIASVYGTLVGLVGVTTTAVCETFAEAGGELRTALPGVSNMCLSVAAPVFGFDGVANIVLRTAPESKSLALGAFDGVSAMLWCTRFRPVALR
jgi:hypothetical protein